MAEGSMGRSTRKRLIDPTLIEMPQFENRIKN